MPLTLQTPLGHASIAPRATRAAAAPEESGSGAVVQWTAWPIRDRWRTLWWAPVSVVLLGVLAGAATESAACGVIAALGVALSMARLWLPTRYSVTSAGLRVGKRGVVIPWSWVRRSRAQSGAAMIQVRPPGGAPRLLHLPLPARNRRARVELRRRLARSA